jgi:hypothetical protein
MKLADVVQKYIQIRDRRAQRKEAFTQEDAKDKQLQETIEAKLMEVFIATGVDSCKTPAGTAYTSTKTSATVADKEVYLDFIKQTGEWGLLDVRALKSSIEEYKDKNQALPPGINYREEVSINIRRA